MQQREPYEHWTDALALPGRRPSVSQFVAFLCALLFVWAAIAVHLLSMRYGSRVPTRVSRFAIHQHGKTRYVRFWVWATRLVFTVLTGSAMVTFLVLVLAGRSGRARRRPDPSASQAILLLLQEGLRRETDPEVKAKIMDSISRTRAESCADRGDGDSEDRYRDPEAPEDKPA